METTKENNMKWEEDPLYFIFNDEIPGKVKMHTRRLDLKDWVKIDATYPAQMKLRNELIKTEKEQVFVSNGNEETDECKWELFELLVEYLPKRFPDIFELQGNFIYNKVLKTNVSTLRGEGEEDPIIKASRLTQEDWVIIEWDDKEQGYVLTAGIVYFPMRWSLQEKFNKSIAGIHIPVKPFMDHLVRKVYDVFSKMKPEAPIWRANWAVFNDLKDPLDLFTPTGSLDRNDINRVSVFKGKKTGKELTFRAEYQTLRKLPKTKCIVFSIRTYQRFLEEFENFPTSDVKGLIKAIDTIDSEFTIYKGAEFWKDASLKYLQSIVDEREAASASKFAYVIPLLMVGAICSFGWMKYRKN